MVIRRRIGLTAQIAPRALATVLVVLALVATGCSSDGLGAGEAATVADGSVALVAVDGETWESFDAGARVPDGASVRAEGAEAALHFRDGAAVRLAPGSTGVVREDGIELGNGEVLVDGTGGLAAVVGDTTVSGDALFRVSGGLSSRVGVYSGTATVARPSQSRDVPALRQLELSSFRLAATADPLRYRDADDWDQEFLGEAIAFDGEAARLANGIDIEIGRSPLRPRFYAQFAGRGVVRFLDEAATVQRRGAFGPPSDVLLTVFVSRAAAAPLGRSVQHVTALRDAGAKWGLILLDLDVNSDKVIAGIDRLGDRRLATAAEDAAVPRNVERAANAAGGAASGNPDGTDVASNAGDDATSTTGSGGGTGSSTPPPGGGGGGGGEDDDGGGGGGDGDSDTVNDVVSEVITAVEPVSGGDPGGKDPVNGVEVPELP